MELKKCPRCGLLQPIECFARDASKASGRKSHCKGCDAARARTRYASQNPQGRNLLARELLSLGLKECPSCGAAKPLNDFPPDTYKPRGMATYCRDCRNELRRERHAIARARAVRIYGGHCAVCGSRKQLEFDHIDWDGATHRRVESGKRMIRRIARIGAPIPEYRLQLLCIDCHRARGQAMRETLREGPFDPERVDARLRELRHDAIYRYA